MSNTLFLNVPRTDTGLQTAAYTIPTGGAGIYSVHFEVTEFPPSSLVVKVKKGGSDVFTAPTITPTQGALQFKYTALYADADAITVVMTSTDDSTLNAVKSIVSIEAGL